MDYCDKHQQENKKAKYEVWNKVKYQEEYRWLVKSNTALLIMKMGSPGRASGKESTCQCRWRRQWHPTPVLLPGESHGWRSLVGCSPWGREESDMTEQLHFHFSLSCIGEGNGNPLQCSCLENPRDGGAWWAAVHGFAQSWTRLKRLSSSSSSCGCEHRLNCCGTQA